MRIRMLKPQFFVDEDVLACSFAARILFLSLWTQADREGRLEYRPGWIKLHSMPTDDVDICDLLDELEEAGFVIPYEVNGSPYLWVRSLKKHQHFHKNEQPSELPPPPPDVLRDFPESRRKRLDGRSKSPEDLQQLACGNPVENSPDARQSDVRPHVAARQSDVRNDVRRTSRTSSRTSRRTSAHVAADVRWSRVARQDRRAIMKDVRRKGIKSKALPESTVPAPDQPDAVPDQHRACPAVIPVTSYLLPLACTSREAPESVTASGAREGDPPARSDPGQGEGEESVSVFSDGGDDRDGGVPPSDMTRTNPTDADAPTPGREPDAATRTSIIAPHPEPTTAGFHAVGALITPDLANAAHNADSNGNGGQPSHANDDEDPALDPHAPVAGLNPWRVLRINVALATQYDEFNTNATPFLNGIVAERIKAKQPIPTNLEAANLLLEFCQTRKIQYPAVLLKRVKQMQARARSAGQ